MTFPTMAWRVLPIPRVELRLQEDTSQLRIADLSSRTPRPRRAVERRSNASSILGFLHVATVLAFVLAMMPHDGLPHGSREWLASWPRCPSPTAFALPATPNKLNVIAIPLVDEEPEEQVVEDNAVSEPEEEPVDEEDEYEPPDLVNLPPAGFRVPESPVCYEVDFADPNSATVAVENWDETTVDGRRIRVTVNPAQATRVNVQGIGDITDNKLKQLFGLAGEVVNIHRLRDVLYGEVRFETADEAWDAKVTLDNSLLNGKRLHVELDCSTHSLNKALVHGLSPTVTWRDLKKHFEQAGQIKWVQLHGGYTARVSFYLDDDAKAAMRTLNGKRLPGYDKALSVAMPWDSYMHSAEIRVRNLPKENEIPKEELRELLMSHFSTVAEVADVRIAEELPPPEFCVPLG